MGVCYWLITYEYKMDEYKLKKVTIRYSGPSLITFCKAFYLQNYNMPTILWSQEITQSEYIEFGEIMP